MRILLNVLSEYLNYHHAIEAHVFSSTDILQGLGERVDDISGSQTSQHHVVSGTEGGTIPCSDEGSACSFPEIQHETWVTLLLSEDEKPAIPLRIGTSVKVCQF